MIVFQFWLQPNFIWYSICLNIFQISLYHINVFKNEEKVKCLNLRFWSILLGSQNNKNIHKKKKPDLFIQNRRHVVDHKRSHVHIWRLDNVRPGCCWEVCVAIGVDRWVYGLHGWHHSGDDAVDCWHHQGPLVLAWPVGAVIISVLHHHHSFLLFLRGRYGADGCYCEDNLRTPMKCANYWSNQCSFVSVLTLK